MYDIYGYVDIWGKKGAIVVLTFFLLVFFSTGRRKRTRLSFLILVKLFEGERGGVGRRVDG